MQFENVKTMRRLYPMTRERSEIESKGQLPLQRDLNVHGAMEAPF